MKIRCLKDDQLIYFIFLYFFHISHSACSEELFLSTGDCSMSYRLFFIYLLFHTFWKIWFVCLFVFIKGLNFSSVLFCSLFLKKKKNLNKIFSLQCITTKIQLLLKLLSASSVVVAFLWLALCCTATKTEVCIFSCLGD